VKATTIGIIDYGIGNHASVAHSLRDIGYRVRVTKDAAQLDKVDALILPGVGAYPAAMSALHEQGLVGYLKEQAKQQRPLIGICLGMQLLASTSYEHERTDGLDLIPGEIVPFENHSGHIGWNTLKSTRDNSFLTACNGQAFYFNHSYYYQGASDYQVALTKHSFEFSSVIRRGSVIGLQFHPEKSQTAGKALLKNIITELVTGFTDA